MVDRSLLLFAKADPALEQTAHHQNGALHLHLAPTQRRHPRWPTFLHRRRSSFPRRRSASHHGRELSGFGPWRVWGSRVLFGGGEGEDQEEWLDAVCLALECAEGRGGLLSLSLLYRCVVDSLFLISLFIRSFSPVFVTRER